MENERDNETKYSIEQLVEIGDYLHDTDCSVLFIQGNSNNKNTSMISVKGNLQQIKTMIYNAMLNNDEILDIFSEVLLKISIDNYGKMIDENNK